MVRINLFVMFMGFSSAGSFVATYLGPLAAWPRPAADHSGDRRQHNADWSRKWAGATCASVGGVRLARAIVPSGTRLAFMMSS